MTTQPAPTACPVHSVSAAGQRDDRKSAAIAARNTRPEPGARIAGSFAFAREILRSPQMRQAGASADQVTFDNPEHVSFFFLDGDLHRRRRAAVATYFAPRTITTRYHPIMQRTMDALIAGLQAKGSAPLDQLSFQMAVDIAAQIVGLTESDSTALAGRLARMLTFTGGAKRGWLAGKLHAAMMAWRAWTLIRKDLRPAVEARRKAPKDDVISYMVRENYSTKSMLIECMTYGTAGMLTTREFIVMVAWHLFGNDALRQRFLDGGEDEQFAIIEEILRLEPVAAMLHRRAAAALPDTAGGAVAEGELLAIDIRAANTDEAITGPCPFALDPDRARHMRVGGAYLSFGDGPHRCPGAQVALHETRIFLDRLLRVPGIRLANEPEIEWNAMLGSYELRGAVVTCDPG